MPSYAALLLLFLVCAPMVGQQTGAQLFDQAVRLQQAGKWAEAEKSYRAYVRRFGATPEALANLGAVLVRQERFPEAVSAYSQALKLAPNLLPIQLNLGLAYFKSGQLAPAVKHFSAVLEKEPRNIQARQLRAMSLLEMERFNEAAQDYSALMPTEDVNVRLGLASAYMRLNRGDEARQLIEPLMASDSAEVKLLLGQVLVETARLDEAKAALERAIELNPTLPTVHLNLGAVYWRQQNPAAAIAEWRKELADHPDSFQASYTLGAALALSTVPEQNEEAEGLLRKAVALEPSNSQGLYQLAKLIWTQSQNPEAMSLLERSVKADPNHRQAHYLLGSIYQRLGRKEEAAREFAAVRRITNEEQRRSQDLFESAQ